MNCADPAARTKVLKAVTGTADENACGEPTTTVAVYPTPPTTFRFGEPAV